MDSENISKFGQDVLISVATLYFEESLGQQVLCDETLEAEELNDARLLTLLELLKRY